jgi:hypothetical protein
VISRLSVSLIIRTGGE